MPFYGAAIVCGDDPGVRSNPADGLAARSSPTAWGSTCRCAPWTSQALPGGQMRFTCQRRNGTVLPDLQITLNLPGEHNVCKRPGPRLPWPPSWSCPMRPVVKALAEFTGVGRRFQRYGELPSSRRRRPSR